MGFIDKLKDVFKGFYEDKQEIQSEEQSLQELARKITYQLVTFWGAPAYLKSYVPAVKILGKEQYKTFRQNPKADIDVEIPRIACVRSTLGNLQYYEIIINEKWFSMEFESGLTNIKSSIAEEIGHYIHFSISPSSENNYDVEEFFGMISRLYMTEQSPELFRDANREVFQKSLGFSEEKEKLVQTLNAIESMENLVDKYKSGGRIPDEIFEKMKQLEFYKEAANNNLAHMSYKPAAAWYYEIRKMKPEERYRLITMSPDEFKRTVMQDAEKRLQEITKTIQNRMDAKSNVSKDYPNTAQFFERQAKEADFQGYGRGEEVSDEYFRKQDEEDLKKAEQETSEEYKQFAEEERIEIAEALQEQSKDYEEFRKEDEEEIEKIKKKLENQ